MSMINASSPAWYKATTLSERLATLSADSKGLFSQQAYSDKQLKLLERWKELKPFDQPGYFAQRLANDGLTEQELLGLLVEPVESVQARIPLANYHWMQKLLDAFSATLPTKEQMLPASLEEKLSATFLALLKPLIYQAHQRFENSVKKSARQRNRLPIDLNTLSAIFFDPLLQELEQLIMPTMILELQSARLLGKLQGETPEARFQSFIEQLKQGDYALTLLQEYPVLARLIITYLENWIEFTTTFLHRLCHDWESILRAFGREESPGVVVKINASAGDRHRGGQRVIIAEFSSGWKLVYKPKSLSIDLHFQSLLQWFNDCGFAPEFRTLQILDRGTHGWVEFISAQTCETVEEVKRFFQRQGGYLALLIGIRGADFHYENVIAAGEHPILIDLESLFHPSQIIASGKATSIGDAHGVINDSVLATYLLPDIRLSIPGFDIGAMGNMAESSDRTYLGIENAGTDQMRYVRKTVTTYSQVGNHQPTLNNKAIVGLDYLDDILSGFTKMYRLLLDRREALLKEKSPLRQFANDPVRVVARNSAIYSLLLRQCLQPHVLRDGLSYEKACDRLWLEVTEQPRLERLIPCERRDLWRFDIPYFTTKPNSKHLWDSDGECIPDYLDYSGLELVENRLQNLSEEDYKRQVWFIQAAFVRTASGSEPARKPIYLNKLTGRQSPLEIAKLLGDKIEALAIQDEKSITWVDLYTQEQQWFVGAGSVNLFSGLPGIALFLSSLGHVTKDERYTKLAQKTVASLLFCLESPTMNLKPSLRLSGAFDGWGGIIYALKHIGILWQDARLLTLAESYVEQLPELIHKNGRIDILSGAAGCIACLTSLHRYQPSERLLNTAVRYGDWLLEQGQQTANGVHWPITENNSARQPGFANGMSGIAWSLFALYACSHQPRFYEAAGNAIAHERAQLANQQQPRPANWHSGTTGIALARLSSLTYMDEPETYQEIELAVENILDNGPGNNHSLGYGALGNLEFLNRASALLSDTKLKAKTESLTNNLLESMHREGIKCGAPLGAETVGLIAGWAGVGYGLLKLTHPEEIPSVLLLELPATGS